MIKYYGKHGCKQFIRGKPIRFGYKAWCLNQTNGYLVNLELYQGARLNTGEEDALNVGKAATPLIRMIDELPEDIIRLPFRFYFNNLLTGMNLLYHLKSLKFGETGTIRQNRIPKKCPIIVQTYLISYRTMPRGSGRPIFSRSNGRVLNSTRYDNIGHFVTPVPMNKRRRCAAEQCQSVGRNMCGKCDVGLYVACFEDYHTKR